MLETKPRRYWQVATGSKGKIWKKCKDESLIAINASGAQEDISDKSLLELEQLIIHLREENNREPRDPSRKARIYRRFVEISIGDIVVAKRGLNHLLGIGIVKSPYRFDKNQTEFAHVRDVDWLYVEDVKLPKDFSRSEVFIQDTVYELTDSRTKLVDFVNSLVDLEGSNENLEDAAENGIWGISNLLRNTYRRSVSQEELSQVKQKAAEVGRKGEIMIDRYFSSLLAGSKISSYQWCSDVNALSPYDFEVTYLDGSICRVEVKATEGHGRRALWVA